MHQRFFAFAVIISASTLACASMRSPASIAQPAQSAPVAQPAQSTPAAPRAAGSDEPVADVAAERAALDAVCGACHDTGLVEGGMRLPAQWDETIASMQGLGAQGTEQQLSHVRSYLLRNWGRANVNTASAKDLAPVLNVTPAVADAVASYRTSNGPFKTIDDLKKVPGVNAENLAARQDRLLF